MGVIKRLGFVLSNLGKLYETGGNYALGQSLSSNAVSSLFGRGGSAINVLEEYNGFAWKVINIRAEMLSAEDLFVERLVGKQWQADPSHPFNLILEGGEGQYDLSELLEAHSKSMDLYGESFWYFSKGASYGKPMAVYLLDPASMTLMVKDNRVTGYVYQHDGVRATLELDEVKHFRIIDPRQPFRGYGPMQAAGWFVRSQRYVTTYVNNFLENNAIPAGVIVAKGTVDDGDWQQFKNEWKSKYAGIDNAGKTGFVRGSDLEFVKTGLSLGEIDFDKIKNSSRDDVMSMFGISKPMMAIFDDINRASATVAFQLFAKTFTKPALKKLTRKLTKSVASWYGAQYQIESTNPVPEDDEIKLQIYDKGVGRWVTINEARAAYGLDPLPGGDLIDTTKAPTPDTTKSLGKITVKTVNKTTFSYEMKESFRGQTEKLQEKYEEKFFRTTQPILKEQKASVISQITPKKANDTQFSVDQEAKKLDDALYNMFLQLATEQGALSIVFAGDETMKFELTPMMEKYIQTSISKATKSFTEETQMKIADALAEGIGSSESIADITRRIDAIYDDVLGVKTPGYRIDRLARTEVIKTSNEITEAAYKQTGVVEKKEWFANPGACEFCKALDGSIIRLGGTFVSKDSTIDGVDGGSRVNTYEDVKHPPTHPACRCTIAPVLENN